MQISKLTRTLGASQVKSQLDAILKLASEVGDLNTTLKQINKSLETYKKSDADVIESETVTAVARELNATNTLLNFKSYRKSSLTVEFELDGVVEYGHNQLAIVEAKTKVRISHIDQFVAKIPMISSFFKTNFSQKQLEFYIAGPNFPESVRMHARNRNIGVVCLSGGRYKVLKQAAEPESSSPESSEKVETAEKSSPVSTKRVSVQKIKARSRG